jgi:pimeloyl-ACP methyl ester carboxylesterase
VEASRPASAADDEGILGKVKSFLAFSKGVEGCEKLTFPYMRCLLKHKFNADRFCLVGSHGNEIDAVVFPAAALVRQGALSADPSQMSAKGLVLFCSPNAGFYEGVSQCDINSSWVGLYLKCGLDVCMFNYRGYGLSTGTPYPDACKHDACTLYLHLQQTRNPARILVHGESIGGMIACHVAKVYPVDALVCDRTFASLDATAARLLGPWAGYGLKYCSLWNTDVAGDYLACTCPKVILQVRHTTYTTYHTPHTTYTTYDLPHTTYHVPHPPHIR